MKIKIVVPDGSMQQPVSNLLVRAALIDTVGERTKEGRATVDWIDRFVFQRPQEIPHYLKNGHFDVAIVGEDWIANWGYEFPILLKLPLGRRGNKPVKIVLAVSQLSSIEKVEDLPKGAEVATEYVELASRFFARVGQDVQVVPSRGNTEHKIRYGATAIIDVTESGESLEKNKLKAIHTIMESHTVVVANEASFADTAKMFYIDSFVRLIKGAAQAAQYVMLTANMPAEAIEQASAMMGGLKGPTCSPLRGINGWFSLQSMVPIDKEHEVILKLLEIKVTDIVVNSNMSLIMS